MDPASIAEDTEWTWFRPQMDGQTNGQKDKEKPLTSIPQLQLVIAGVIKISLPVQYMKCRIPHGKFHSFGSRYHTEVASRRTKRRMCFQNGSSHILDTYLDPVPSSPVSRHKLRRKPDHPPLKREIEPSYQWINAVMRFVAME